MKSRIFAASGMMMMIISSPALAAPPWLAGGMKDAGPHPRTLFKASDIPMLQERVQREPYAWMLSQAQAVADQNADLSRHDVGLETTKGSIAKSCAWLYAVNRRYDGVQKKGVPFADEAARRAYAVKAAKHLLSMYTTSRAKGFQPDGDIHTAEELHVWSQALDLLLGSDFDFIVDSVNAKAQAVQNVADLAADLWWDYTANTWITIRSYLNNHRSKSASALGLAAMVLNGMTFEDKKGDGRFDPANWIAFAVRYADLVLMNIETDQEYGYQESASYYSYTAVDHIPFFRAWHAYTGGASFEYGTWDPLEPPQYVISSTAPYTVRDFWTSPVFAGQLDFIWKTMLPDRTGPPYDDSTPGTLFPWATLISKNFPNASVYRWAWETSPYGRGLFRLGGAEDAILLFDDSIPASAPHAFPDTVLPIGGVTIFRSSWETDATALVISNENGNAASRTYTRWGDFFDGLAGHEHQEPASFMLYAGKEALAVDSGYLGWPNHGKVNNPDNHNILLVDGFGPELPFVIVPEPYMNDKGQTRLANPEREGGWTLMSDSDAFLDGWHSTPRIDTAVVRTRYKRADLAWTRKFIFIDKKYLVIEDEFKAGDGEDHMATFQLHGNGGGTSNGTFALNGSEALWTQKDSRLRALLLSDHDVTISTVDKIYDRWQWDEKTHTTLLGTITLKAGESGRFMAVMAVERKTGADFESTAFLKNGGLVSWSVGGIDYSAELNQPAGASKPDFAAVRADEAKGEFSFFSNGGGDLFSGIKLLVSAGPAVGAAVKDGSFDGYLFSESPGPFTVGGVFIGGSKVCKLESVGTDTKVHRTGTGRFELSSSGSVSGAVPVIDVVSDPPADPNRPYLPVLKPVTLSGKRSCVPAGSTPSFSWVLIRKPELSTAGFKDPGSVETEFTPDLPGAYLVELALNAAGAGGLAQTLLYVDGDVREARNAMADAGRDAGSDSGIETDSGTEDTGADTGPQADAGGPKGGTGCSCSNVGL